MLGLLSLGIATAAALAYEPPANLPLPALGSADLARVEVGGVVLLVALFGLTFIDRVVLGGTTPTSVGRDGAVFVEAAAIQDVDNAIKDLLIPIGRIGACIDDALELNTWLAQEVRRLGEELEMLKQGAFANTPPAGDGPAGLAREARPFSWQPTSDESE